MTLDLDDVRRRLRTVSDEANALDALTDDDLRFLLTNGWKPPEVEAAPAPNPATSGTFVLTTEEYHAYRRAVNDAQEIRRLLDIAKLHGDDDPSVARLRAELQLKADKIKELAEQWKHG